MNCPTCNRYDEFVFEEDTRVWRCDRCHEKFMIKPQQIDCDAAEEFVKVPRTNADRIRGMSDEELAGIIAAEFTAERIPFCQNKPECDRILNETEDCIPESMCVECVVDWLRQPAETEGTE